MRSKDIKDKIKSREIQLETIPDDDAADNHGVVMESTRLQKACKKKHVHLETKMMGSGCSVVLIVLGAVVTYATCLSTGLGYIVCLVSKRCKWQDMNKQCRAIRESAAHWANICFSRTIEGGVAFMPPRLHPIGDLLAFFNDKCINLCRLHGCNRPSGR